MSHLAVGVRERLMAWIGVLSDCTSSLPFFSPCSISQSDCKLISYSWQSWLIVQRHRRAANVQTVIVARFLQGAAGSTGATMVGGTIADIWGALGYVALLEP